MAPVRTLAQQRRGYFARPSVGRPDGAVFHPSAWRGEDLSPDRWRVVLTDAELDELGGLADRFLEAGTPMGAVDAARVALAELAPRLAGWRRTLAEGLGVVVLRGLPVRAWGEDKTAMAYWCLGHALGTPGPQNPAGDLLGEVTDLREPDRPLARLYRTAAPIAFHCDSADVVGLLMVRGARAGGESCIASSTTIHNEMVRRRPDLAAELFRPFAFDRRDEEGPGESPIFELPPAAWDGVMLRVFWHSDYARSAVRHDTVSLDERRLECIDLFDRIGAEAGIRLDMVLQEGDVQFLSNHTVVHARNAYEDHDDPAERRRLFRLWLSLG